MRRLYKDGKVSEKKIVDLYVSKKINDDEKWYILNARKGL